MSTSLGSFRAVRVVEYPSLVCPVSVIWRDYLSYCRCWGFDECRPIEFVAWLTAIEGVTVEKRGSGRLRRVAIGIGLKPMEEAA